MHSIGALLWAIFLLVSIIFIFACYITQAVNVELIKEESQDLGRLTEQELASMDHIYGSLLKTMYFLYQGISGGNDWGVFADPLFKISPVLGLTYCLYIALMTVAVLNVVTGVFVDQAIKSTELD